MDEDVEYKACDGSLECNDSTDAFETKEQLYKFFKTQGIDFDDIDEESRLPKFLNKVLKNESAEYNKFNNILYKLHKENKIKIIDSVGFLVEDWLEPTPAIKCLDEMNYYSLMNGLKEKYKLNSRNDLSEFFS